MCKGFDLLLFMSGADEDLSTKFQRLLQEYNKIKKQNGILKKAVIQVRDKFLVSVYKSNEVQEKQLHTQLQVESKEREIAHRATREENEILSFNNQRLTKRLTKLQEEFSDKNKHESSGWFSSGSKTELARVKHSLEVTRQELSIKIEENGIFLRSPSQASFSLMNEQKDFTFKCLKERKRIKQLWNN